MRANEILNEGLKDKVEALIDELHLKAVGPHPYTNRPGEAMTLLDRKPGFRMWTRFDGSKYREPSYISAFPYMKDKDIKAAIKKGYLKIPLDNNVDVINWVWDEINAKGAKPVGKVKGEFGSSEYSPAVILDGVLYIKERMRIVYATRSLLRNLDVWKQEQ